MIVPSVAVPDTSVVQPHGWAGTIEEFLSTPPSTVIESLCDHLETSLLLRPDNSQLAAWREELQVLRAELKVLVELRPNAVSWGVILEYELPRESGRRPDAIILAGDTIVVVEFKGMRAATQAAIDQVAAYRRDLAAYHAGSQDRTVLAALVLTASQNAFQETEDALITGRTGLGDWLGNLPVSSLTIAIEGWLASPYSPLPSLVSAARQIFEHEALPHIRRAQSAGIPETIAALQKAAKEAASDSGRHLALVTGVPGAGKTLVGLQFVYATREGNSESSTDAVFLSGNGPLVQVLQHALRSTVFVQAVHGFLRDYGGNSGRLPREHIWVYDEAQRAWDAQRVREKRGHKYSEPEDFVRLAERTSDWALVVGLIGEGQEIHIGEESGLGQWNDALSRSSLPWTVHCPTRLAGLFPAADRIEANDALDLTTSLRSHVAEDVQRWVNTLLRGELDKAAKYMANAAEQGFDAYLTRDLDEAKAYVLTRYRGEFAKRYGLIASSKAKNLPLHGIPQNFAFSRFFPAGPWYNDPPNSLKSCCQLREVATEFSCQGLELDMPIICWGNDLTWQGNWQPVRQPRSKANNPEQLRLNSYRVLLSRGRDGMVIWVPPDSELDATFDALLRSGVPSL
jgi:hypothetical protein